MADNLIERARLTEKELEDLLGEDFSTAYSGHVAEYQTIADAQLAKALWTVVDAWAARSDTRVAGELRKMLVEAGVERPASDEKTPSVHRSDEA